MAKPKLKVYPSLDPNSLSVGWERKDLPMVHVFAQGAPGKRFKPSNGRGGPHWPCSVCEAHGYTEKDFHEDMMKIMAEDNN